MAETRPQSQHSGVLSVLQNIDKIKYGLVLWDLGKMRIAI